MITFCEKYSIKVEETFLEFVEKHKISVMANIMMRAEGCDLHYNIPWKKFAEDPAEAKEIIFEVYEASYGTLKQGNV